MAQLCTKSEMSLMSPGSSATAVMSKTKETFPLYCRHRFVCLSKVKRYAKLHNYEDPRLSLANVDNTSTVRTFAIFYYGINKIISCR